MSVAAFYQTSQWAGGDYYDFFPLPDGKWGILIADVSGHGTPAAVLMAVTHSLAHGFPGPHDPPSALLTKVNQQLTTLYNRQQRVLCHRLLRDLRPQDPSPELLERRAQPASADAVQPVDHRVARARPEPAARPGRRRGLRGFPPWSSQPGDQLALYTDGITEAIATDGRMFGLERLDAVLSRCGGTAQQIVDDVINEVKCLHPRRTPGRRSDVAGNGGVVIEW